MYGLMPTAPGTSVPSLRHRLVRRLALRLRRWARGRARTGVGPVLGAARATMRRVRYCVLATAGDDGVDARALQPFPPAEDLTVWMGTSPRSRKVAQLRRDPRATLVYEDDGRGACVVLAGRAEIVDALEERSRRFMALHWAFFPDGPAGDDYVLLRFVPERVEVWDSGRRITPEPFGLRAARLVRQDGAWREA